MKFIKGMERQVRQSSSLNLMLSMHPFPQTNCLPQLMLTLIQMVRTKKQYILFFYCYHNYVFIFISWLRRSSNSEKQSKGKSIEQTPWIWWWRRSWLVLTYHFILIVIITNYAFIFISWLRSSSENRCKGKSIIEQTPWIWWWRRSWLVATIYHFILVVIITTLLSYQLTPLLYYWKTKNWEVLLKKKRISPLEINFNLVASN